METTETTHTQEQQEQDSIDAPMKRFYDLLELSYISGYKYYTDKSGKCGFVDFLTKHREEIISTFNDYTKIVINVVSNKIDKTIKNII